MALIEITLTIPGQAGPFDLFSDVDSYAVPFATSVPAADLVAGYIVDAPAGTQTVRVISIGVCTNYIDLPTNCPTTTTTSSSSTTTTSTSSSTTTSTTTVQQIRLNWELITNTPGSLLDIEPQSSQLKVDVNGNNVVDATITGNASSQSGAITIEPGDVVSASIETNRVGTYNFINTIVKDGVFYQPQDACNDCNNSYITLMSPDYSGNGSEDPVSFSFVADTYKELTTTTTTTPEPTTTTTSSSSSTTTTSTTPVPDCGLFLPSAVVVSGTTTTTSSKFPVTTTTSTTSATLYPGARSGISYSSNVGSATICNVPITNFVFRAGQFPGPSVGDILYNDTSASTTFNGQNRYWRYEDSIQGTNPQGYIVQVDTNGAILFIEQCFA
ncbi:MAG: hypothetical protein ACXAB9_06095 [Candidatus Thorarchaeota archaeon]|jgi:hypothetical protein